MSARFIKTSGKVPLARNEQWGTYWKDIAGRVGELVINCDDKSS